MMVFADRNMCSCVSRNKYGCPNFIYSPTNALVSCLKKNIKIFIKTAPTSFGAVTPPTAQSTALPDGGVTAPKHVRAVLV
jgi:hypothetical protein